MVISLSHWHSFSTEVTMGQFEEYVNGLTEVAGQDYSARRKFNNDRLKDFKEALKKGRLVFSAILF